MLPVNLSFLGVSRQLPDGDPNSFQWWMQVVTQQPRKTKVVRDAQKNSWWTAEAHRTKGVCEIHKIWDDGSPKLWFLDNRNTSPERRWKNLDSKHETQRSGHHRRNNYTQVVRGICLLYLDVFCMISVILVYISIWQTLGRPLCQYFEATFHQPLQENIKVWEPMYAPTKYP